MSARLIEPPRDFTEYCRIMERALADAIITEGFRGMRNVLHIYLPAYVNWLEEQNKDKK